MFAWDKLASKDVPSIARYVNCAPASRVIASFKTAIKDFLEDECPVRAAALAYYTVFALPPLLILLVVLAGLVWDPAEVERALGAQFTALIGSEAAETITGMVRSADRPGTGGIGTTLLGLGGLLFGATGAFLQLQGALNHAWEVEPDKSAGGVKGFLLKRMLSFGMILGIAFLLVVSLVVSAGIAALGERYSPFSEPLLHVVNFVVSFVVLTALFAMIFKYLPDTDVRWRDAWVGAVATSLLFVVGKLLIGLYLGRSEPGSAYGAASALAVILIWIYYSGMIVLFGAELTQAWSQRRAPRQA
jgi:membrane protein